MRWVSLLYKRVVFVCLIAILIFSSLASVANAKYSDETVTIKAFEPQAWVDLRDGGSEYHLISRPNASPGQDVAIKFHINNTGNIPSGPFVVYVYASLDRTFDPAGDFFIAETKIDSIPPQDGVEFYGSEAAHGIIPYGMQDLDDDLVYNVYWIIDPVDQVEEKNEDNNLIECGGGQQITVRHRDPLNDVFDLVDAGEEFRSFENAADGTQIAQNGDTIKVSCKIRNAGNLPSGSYNVTFYAHNDCYINGEEDEVFLGSKEMTSEGICNFSFEIETDQNEPGYNLDAGYKYYIGWIIDAEEGESVANNEATKMGYTLFVTLSEDINGNDSVIDLVDEGYQCYSSPGDNKLRSFVPQEVYAGESIVVHTIIRNRGNADINNSFVVNFYAGGTNIDHNDHLLGTAEIQSLAGGESVTTIIEGNTTSLAPGNYFVGWIIDERYENGNWVSDVAESTYYDYNDPYVPKRVFGEDNNIAIIKTVPATKLTILTCYISLETYLNNDRQHHTEGYPPEYQVLRRGQSFYLSARIGGFDDDYQEISIIIVKPNQHIEWLVARKEAGRIGPGWDCTYEQEGFDWPDNFFIKIHIPGDEQVGKYRFGGVRIHPKNGGGFIDCDVLTPEFYVLFNPWSSEEVDVYNPAFTDKELKHYLGQEGYNYYREYLNSNNTTVVWDLSPRSREVFDIAVLNVAGNTSARAAAKGLAAKAKSYIEYCRVGDCDPSPQTWKFDWSEWGGIPALLRYKKNGTVYGQCMDREALLNAFQRSVGIPARMLVTGKSGNNRDGNEFIKDVDVYGESVFGGGCGHERWRFHCWDEMWLNNEWHSVDGSYEKGPSSRSDVKNSKSMHDLLLLTPVSDPEYYLESAAFIHDEISLPTQGYFAITRTCLPEWRQEYRDEPHTATEMWTYNAAAGVRENILPIYLDPTPQSLLATDLPLLIVNVSCNRSTYQIGEGINATLVIENTQTENITVEMGFAIYEEELSTGECIRGVFNDTRTITIPAGSTYKYNYLVPHSIYKHAGAYVASAGAYNASMAIADGDRDEFVITGSKLIISAPPIVTINETFDISLTVENVLDIPINDVDVHGYFSYYADVSGAPINFTIPALAPGSTNTTTWSVSMPVAGTYPIGFDIFSNETGLSHNSTVIKVRSNPFLRVNVEVPSSVQKDTTFTVSATIVNEGDLAAEAVQSELNLPPELTTSDDLIQYIGTIDPHANTTIVWNLVANEAGISAFTVVTNSSTDSCEVVIFIPVFIYDHDIALSVEQSRIEADGELHNINMTIHNLGEVDDSVFLQYLVTNPDISFSIYDGDEWIIFQPVTVPANGNKTLTLKIMPEYEATGAITIHATSELDPMASNSTNIEVISPILDTTPPSVSSPTATPSSIVADGIRESQLNATVTDESGIAGVTIDLTDIGGSPTQEMNNIPGTDIYTVITIAATGTAPDTYGLQVNATDIYDNSNTSVSVALTVLIPATVDVLIALKMAAGSSPPTTAADVNNDGEVSSLDALMILQAAAGAITL